MGGGCCSGFVLIPDPIRLAAVPFPWPIRSRAHGPRGGFGSPREAADLRRVVGALAGNPTISLSREPATLGSLGRHRERFSSGNPRMSSDEVPGSHGLAAGHVRDISRERISGLPLEPTGDILSLGRFVADPDISECRRAWQARVCQARTYSGYLNRNRWEVRILRGRGIIPAWKTPSSTFRPDAPADVFAVLGDLMSPERAYWLVQERVLDTAVAEAMEAVEEARKIERVSNFRSQDPEAPKWARQSWKGDAARDRKEREKAEEDLQILRQALRHAVAMGEKVS